MLLVSTEGPCLQYWRRIGILTQCRLRLLVREKLRIAASESAPRIAGAARKRACRCARSSTTPSAPRALQLRQASQLVAWGQSLTTRSHSPSSARRPHPTRAPSRRPALPLSGFDRNCRPDTFRGPARPLSLAGETVGPKRPG